MIHPHTHTHTHAHPPTHTHTHTHAVTPQAHLPSIETERCIHEVQAAPRVTEPLPLRLNAASLVDEMREAGLRQLLVARFPWVLRGAVVVGEEAAEHAIETRCPAIRK